MKPHFKEELASRQCTTWVPIPADIKYQKAPPKVEGLQQSSWFELSFTHRFGCSEERKQVAAKYTEQARTYFSFCEPWSYEDNQDYLNEMERKLHSHPDIYFVRELLCHTLEGR